MKRTLLLAAVLILAVQVWAYDFEENGIYYIRSGNGNAEVTYGDNPYEGKVIIPPTASDRMTTYNVTSIGNRAFDSCSGLTSVEIPNSITSIGEYAFFHCSGLTSIEIPNSVISIGYLAFNGCSCLTSITVSSENNAYSSENGVLFNKAKSILITYPNAKTGGYIIPHSVTGIGHAAFSNCSGLTSVEIPFSVTSIGWSVFSNCSGLTSIEIPNSITNIGGYAFFSSGLTSIEIPNSVKSIEMGAFGWCPNLISVEIPNSVTSIGEYAFASCSSLISVIVLNLIPGRITLGRDVFIGIEGYTLLVPSAAVDEYAYKGRWSTGNIQGGGLLVALESDDNEQGRVSKSGLYQSGETVSLSATPTIGYRFVNWTENGTVVSTGASYSFTVTKDRELVANFSPSGNSIEHINTALTKIYPNPTTGKVFIKTQSGSTPQVRVFDLQGVLLQENQSDEVDLTGYTKGVYLIEVDGKVSKIIKE